ncbi:MAG: 50S ribosomal protein L17 [Planctomycetota bacterium]
MRHRVHKKKLGRTTAHRQSMERNMICSIIKHERIVTTLAKAKAIRRDLEKMITLGKQKDVARVRRAVSYLRDREAAQKLFDELGPRYASRPGGYSRVVRLAERRIGDGTERAILELVDNQVLANQLAAREAEAAETETTDDEE